MSPLRRVTVWLLSALVFSAGCSSARSPRTAPSAATDWPWPLHPSLADSVFVETLAPGIRLYRLVDLSVPWRAAVLDLDLSQCVSLRALKGSHTAVGRTTTSALLATVPSSRGPVAAVNADFFLFAPPGVPTGAHVEHGRVVAGPGARPVFGVDSAGRPFIDRLVVSGRIDSRRGVLAVAQWNRGPSDQVTVLDAGWGQPVDSASAPPHWRLVPASPGQFTVRPSELGVIATGDTLLVTGAGMLRAGDTVSVQLGLSPVAPREAVGGFPLLLQDGAMPAAMASAGAASFRGPNPRTAVGIAAGGRRVLLVVIDGRQSGWSAGATLEQTAVLLRALGAREALNLDGGGSSAMALASGVGRDAALASAATGRVVSRPSDAGGERGVGNALAVLSSCDQNK